MNVAQLIQTLVATVVGGCIVIVTNWLNRKGERKEAVQEWYERTYLVGGIDPLVTYYQNLAFTLISKAGENAMPATASDIPVEALGKIRVLLKGEVTPLNIILSAYYLLTECTEKETLREASQTLLKAVEVMATFRVELTELIANRVRKKHAQIDASSLIKKLEKIDQELRNFVEPQKQQESATELEKV